MTNDLAQVGSRFKGCVMIFIIEMIHMKKNHWNGPNNHKLSACTTWISRSVESTHEEGLYFMLEQDVDVDNELKQNWQWNQ